MSKIALKITRKLLTLADKVYDRIEGARVEALYRELSAVRKRDIARAEAAEVDGQLAVAIREELALLENDDDEDDL